MLLQEILNLRNDPGLPGPITDAYQYDTHLVINKKISLPVHRVSNSYDKNSPIAITLNGIVIGYLIFPTVKGAIEIGRLTDYELVSYLSIADETHYFSGDPIIFETDFLVIEEEFLIDYIEDFKETSPLWGGFSHELSAGMPTIRYKKVITALEIGYKLKPLDQYSYESIIRAIEQPYAFERYLKLYHLLELQFDFFVINQIKNLVIPRDSNLIGSILNDYSDREMLRLTDIMESFCKDMPALESKMALVTSFPVIAKEMFITFGKSANAFHLVDENIFQAVLAAGSFDDTTFRRLKVPANNNHSKLIVNICAYWIYRIRCSIAHNKIGEYLLSSSDENFIVEFGEPLLREVLLQLFNANP